MQPTRPAPPECASVRVVIISQDESVRMQFRAAIELDPAMTIAGEASNGHQGLALVRDVEPDLVMVDNDLPGQSGCAIAAAIKWSIPGSRIALLALVADFDHLAAGMWCGAKTLRRDADEGTIRRVIHGVLSERQHLYQAPAAEAEEDIAGGF